MITLGGIYAVGILQVEVISIGNIPGNAEELKNQL